MLWLLIKKLDKYKLFISKCGIDLLVHLDGKKIIKYYFS